LRYVEKEKKTIEQKKRKIATAKELKANIPKLEKHYFKLKKHIRKEEAKLMADTKLARPIKKRLATRETQLRKRELGLQKGVELLGERERELTDLRSMKEDAFEDYLKAELRVAKKIVPIKHVPFPEIHTKLDQARKGIISGDINTAIRRIAEAEVLMNKFKLNKEEKKQFDYDLRYIKASIKLAELG